MEEQNGTERRVVKKPAILAGESRVGNCILPRLHRLSSWPMSATESKQYIWFPLDRRRKEIRVLDLHAGVGQCALRGQLRHVFLDGSSKPEYETISYAWEDTALVDNCLLGDKSMPIPASAGSALRCMRSSVKTRTLWIDCICIDQTNDHEKGHQVGLMADIFQNSRQTLAYLGDVDEVTAERATTGFLVISTAWLNSEGTHAQVEDRKIENWSALRQTIDLEAIKAIIMKPYFT